MIQLRTKFTLPLALAGCALFAIGSDILAHGAQHAETYPSPNTTNQPNGPQSANMDHEFAMNAARGGLAEVQLGKLAEEKGSNPAVKKFGKRMVEDHSHANSQLKTVASQDHIALPSQPSAQDKGEYEKLAKMSGPEFDRAYARAMVRDHMKDISEFKTEANDGSVHNIKEFASSTLPTLQEHLMLAHNMERSVTGANAKGNIGQ